MNKKMRKWEEEYESFRKGDYDKRYEELKEKEENRTITKEELSELKKLDAIKNNLSKVKNIKEFKESLEKNSQKLSSELTKRIKAKNLENEREKLEEEMNSLNTEFDKIVEKLKDKDLPETERTKLEAEKQANENKRQQNNSKFIKNQEEMKKFIPQNGENVMRESIEELNDLKMNLAQKISKCNMACSNLMQGKSWNAIEVKLDNWDKKYTGSKEDANKIKATRTVENENKVVENNTLGKVKESENNILPAVKEEKPKWYQFIKRFKNFVKRVRGNKEIENTETLDIPSDIIDKEMEETSKEIGKDIEKIKEDNDFKKYLKEVAEKGMKGIVREEKIASKERAKERLIAMKQRSQDPNRYYIDENGVKHDTFGQDKEDEGPEKD